MSPSGRCAGFFWSHSQRPAQGGNLAVLSPMCGAGFRAGVICNRTRYALIRLQWDCGVQSVYALSFLPHEGLATCISAVDYCVANPVFVIPYLDGTIEETPSVEFAASLKELRKYLSLVRDESFEPSSVLNADSYTLSNYELDSLESDAMREVSSVFSSDPPRVVGVLSMGRDAGQKTGAFDLLRTAAINARKESLDHHHSATSLAFTFGN